MKKVLIVVFLTLALCGCNNKTEEKKASLSYKEIMQERKYVILDVRTKEEYEESHIKDAINIPYDEINNGIGIDKEKVVFVYCRSGNRSSIAYKTLKSLNYEVYDLGAFDSIDLPKE